MEVIEVNCDSIFHNLVIKQPSALPSNMSNIGQYWAILGDIRRYWAILGDIRRYWAILGDIGAQSRPYYESLEFQLNSKKCNPTRTLNRVASKSLRH